LFKALLAASLAMLACCVAAAWAGPVDPTSPDDFATTPMAGAEPLPPLRDVAPASLDAGTESSFLAKVTADGFAPVSLSATYEIAASRAISPEEAAVVNPAGQPAVIPLPAPLYATAVLLALVLACRRIIFRTC
jgi:hypothetical protein